MTQNGTVEINTLVDLREWLKQWVLGVSARSLILLSGEMGAGKTQMVRDWMELWSGDAVQSPSFSLHNVYDTQKGVVHHWDLYRLENVDELESAGFWDQFALNGVIIVEWPDRVPKTWWPQNWLRTDVTIAKNPNGSRIIHWETIT